VTTPPHHPLFAKGFRPFFLGASLLGATLVLTWLAILFGGVAFAGRSPVLWHGHEMLYGFTIAVVAGFLLTAVGNWTKRETASGTTLVWLTGLWGLGRLAAWVGPGAWLLPAQLIELSFLPVLLVVLGRCIVAARNWRNAGFLVLLVGLWLCDVAYAFGPNPGMALARAVDLVIIMIVIVSGRVIPMFTRNGIGDAGVSHWPRVDAATLLVVVATVLARAAGTHGAALAALEAASAVLLAWRMIPWQPQRTFRYPLVWVLHMGHGWIAVGFALRALHHGAGMGLETLGLHAHTAGAIGVMTLGMMARVALGHTGRPLLAPPGIALAFTLVGLAALVRVLPGLMWPEVYRTSLLVSGLLFSAAHLLYLARYGPILSRPRSDGRPG
jgi:uncharacterized protein involved in response to NO